VYLIRFAKGGGDLEPPAGLPRLHGHKSNDFARRAGIQPKLTLLLRIRLRRKPNSIHGVNANAKIGGNIFSRSIRPINALYVQSKINLFFVVVPDV